MKTADAEPGWFVQWFQAREPVHVFTFGGAWLDVGTAGSYLDIPAWYLDGERRIHPDAVVENARIGSNVHVLAGFIGGTRCCVRDDRLGPVHVTLVMIGPLAPDSVKVNLVVPDAAVAALLGMPISWSPLPRLGDATLQNLLGTLLLAPEYRRIAIALFAIGVVSHFVLDWLLLTSTGYAFPVLWLLTEWRPPAGNLYQSSDRWPALVSILLAATVFLETRRRTTIDRQ